MKALRIALLAASVAGFSPAIAQQFNTIPGATVIGRMPGPAGPSQAIPFATLFGQPGTVPSSRNINTTAPLAGGGNLTADRTLSITGVAGEVLAGSGPAFTATPVLGVPTSLIGTLGFAGNTSGTATITPQATAGTPTITLPNTTGTLADGASSPLVLSATTGNLTCPTCATTTNGGAISGTAPVAVNAAGAISITGAAGQVLAGASPAFTATPVLGVAGATVGSLGFQNATSGTETVQPATGALGTGTATLPAGTYNIVGDSLTQSLTGKTYNGLTITSSAGTLTIPNNASAVFSQSGNFALTLTATGATNSTLPSGTHTLSAPDVAQTATALWQFNSGDFNLRGATSGAITINCASTCGSNTLTLPAGTTDFSSTGGTSQVVKQTSSGGAFTVGQLAFSDITDTAWSGFTASPSCGTATFTTTSARSKTYVKTTHVEIDFTITAIGTCTSALTFTLPNTANSGGGFAGREFGVSGKGFTCDIRSGSATSTCSLGDASAFQVNAHMVASGVYENQ